MARDTPPPATSSDDPNETVETPAARGRGRPVGDREAKRAELLKAAISVIARDGYAGASLRNVAKHAGCTTGAVTYYFENKDAMVTAIAESLFDEFDAIRVRSKDDLRSGLKRWMDWTNAEDPDAWMAGLQLLVHAKHEPALAAVYQRRYGRYREMLTAVITRGQDNGLIRTDIPADLLADQISAMADGWMIMFPIEPKRFQPKRVKALIDATMTLISAPGAADSKAR